jgi:hypothetical protein
MFGTGTRFAEYGITGGFFVVTQTLLLGFTFPDALAQLAAALHGSLGDFINKLPIPAQHAFHAELLHE